MKVTIFTSNQPRYISLIERVAAIAQEVWVVQEPKKNTTSFASNSDEMMECYMSQMTSAEQALFGHQRFLSADINQPVLAMGDLSHIDIKLFAPSLKSDIFIVFGASYIREPLVDFLIANRCINIHMSLFPYYRGSACNFWALWDRRPDYVDGTLHLLSAGLDSGPILCHALPESIDTDGFLLGMLAVEATISTLIKMISNGEIYSLKPALQDRSAQLSYSKGAELSSEIAAKYLENRLSPTEMGTRLRNPDPQRQLIFPDASICTAHWIQDE